MKTALGTLRVLLVKDTFYSFSMALFVLYTIQSLEGAEKYFVRKIEYLTKQIEKVQPGLIEKHRIRQGKWVFV